VKLAVDLRCKTSSQTQPHHRNTAYAYRNHIICPVPRRLLLEHGIQSTKRPRQRTRWRRCLDIHAIQSSSTANPDTSVGYPSYSHLRHASDNSA
jgi:hypothetical protein